MLRRIGILFVIGLTLIITTQNAMATQYTDEDHHYSFTAPDTWTESSMSGADVVFTNPEGASLNVVTVVDVSIRNDESYLLEQAQLGLAEIKKTYDDVETVQEPRTFTTTSNRLAADYIIDWTYLGNQLRLRQVLFVSEYWVMGYILTFSAQKSEFASYYSIWEEAVNSFTVEGERATLGEVLWYIIIGGICGVVVVVIVTVAVLLRKKEPPAPQAMKIMMKKEVANKEEPDKEPEKETEEEKTT